MALPNSTVQRESEKFVEDGSGNVTVRVTPTSATLPTGASTSAKQDTLIENSKVFGLNHIDNYTTTNVVYLGSETDSGEWRIMKMDLTGNFPAVTWASVANNASLTSYTLGWAARTTATYGAYSTAF